MGKIMNWDDVEETSYINEEGTYTLKVESVVKTENGGLTHKSANDKEFHKYICTTSPAEGSEKITLSLYLVPNAMWKYKNFVKACGVSTTGEFDAYELPNLLVGKKFKGEVKRQPDRLNVETGEKEPSKFFEIAKFYKLED